MVFAEIIPSLPHAPGGSRRGRVEAQPAGAGEHRPCGCAAPRRDEHNMKVLLGRAAPSHTLPQVLSGVGFFGGAYSNGQKSGCRRGCQFPLPDAESEPIDSKTLHLRVPQVGVRGNLYAAFFSRSESRASAVRSLHSLLSPLERTSDVDVVCAFGQLLPGNEGCLTFVVLRLPACCSASPCGSCHLRPARGGEERNPSLVTAHRRVVRLASSRRLRASHAPGPRRHPPAQQRR